MKYSTDTLYKQLIQSKEWQRVRNRYIREHPTCEICGKLAVCVHHRKPLNWYRNNPDRMRQLCFDEDNLQALCFDCHERVHRELGKNKNKKEHAAAYHKEKLDNFFKEYLE
jgi:5-methylcytosine-specific restriction protein A